MALSPASAAAIGEANRPIWGRRCRCGRARRVEKRLVRRPAAAGMEARGPAVSLCPEADPAHECQESRIGPQGIELRTHEYDRVELSLRGFLEPAHRLLGIAQSDSPPVTESVPPNSAVVPLPSWERVTF